MSVGPCVSGNKILNLDNKCVPLLYLKLFEVNDFIITPVLAIIQQKELINDKGEATS